MIWFVLACLTVGLIVWSQSRSKRSATRNEKTFPMSPQVRNADSRLSPGEANRRRVAAILNSDRQLTSPVSKSDIDELSLVSIDHAANTPDAILVARPREVPVPPRPTSPLQTNQRTDAKSTAVKKGWIPSGEAVEVAGITITGGMIYVGNRLEPGGNSNCLINPALPVARYADRSGSCMGYWPAYENLRPEERRAFLEWLASDRYDPECYIGFVFLYFYGLERRMFIDEAYADWTVIEAEVRRLLSIYGSNYSFRGYATRFLDALSLLNWDEGKVPEVTLDGRTGFELPHSVKLHIGKKIAQKLPLDADDALLWVINIPDTYLRTPATRCFDEFKILWNIYFRNVFPEGLKVPTPKARLKVTYRAAMGFNGNVKVFYQDEELPDITNVRAPLEKLRKIVDDCTEALDPYSRYLGRNPDAAGTLAAARLLPIELITVKPHSALANVIKGISEALGDRPEGFIAATRLVDLFQIETGPNGLTRSQCSQIGMLLDRLDFAFEPDARYGASAFTTDSSVYLFKAQGGAHLAATSPSYNLYRMMTEIAAIASAADGQLQEEEFNVIEQTIATGSDLTDVEKTRLRGLATALWRNIPKQQGVLKRLAELPESEKRQVAQTAINAVMADGYVDPNEVAFLEKLYKVLGFPVEEVYSSLHRGGVGALAASTSAKPAEYAESTATDTIHFDATRLQRIRSETDVVSQMLANIFTDETSSSPASKPDAPTRPSRFKGLDSAHGQLFEAVLAKGMLSRAEFDEKARALKLLPDGAIETLNEWGFDHFDELVLDGEEEIFILPELADKLRDYVIA